MAKKTDIESILDEIKTILQSNFNNQIDSINTEKNDAVTVAHIDNNAYALQTLNDKVMVYDPFILYGVDDPGAKGIGPATMKYPRLNVIVVLQDNGQDAEIARRVFRYSRALEEVCESYFAGISSSFKLEIESLAPVEFKLLNSSDNYRAVGVSIRVGIA